MNILKAFLFLAGLTILLLAVGDIVAGHAGIVAAIIVAGLMNVNAYFYADKAVLHFSGATRCPEHDAAPVRAALKSLTEKMSLPVPALYVITSDAPNAFATGRDPSKASIAITTGLMNQLKSAELTAVLAYLLIQIARRETLVDGISAVIAEFVLAMVDVNVWKSLVGIKNKNQQPAIHPQLMRIFGRFSAFLIWITVSRTSRFEIDYAAAALSKDPNALIAALEQLDQSKAILTGAEIHPVIGHLFIVDPIRTPTLAALFATHPAVSERVRRLKNAVF